MLAALFLASLMSYGKGIGQTKGAQVAALTDALYRHNQFNGAVLVAEANTVIYRQAYGWADLERQVPLTTTSTFNIGELAKQFTAVAILLLQEDGKLSIDDEVSTYLKEIPYQNIRIRDLLYHTSGLPDYMELGERYWDATRPLNNHEVLALFARYEPSLQFPSGAQFAYSHTGYALLAMLIERISWQAYPDFISSRIFEPLDMEHAFVYQPIFQTLPASAAKSYHLTLAKAFVEEPISYLDGVVGDKGIYASIDDLHRWIKGLQDTAFLSRKSYELLFESGKTVNGTTTHYAMGWVTLQAPDAVYHDGNWLGYYSTLVYYPITHHFILLLSNRKDRVIAIQRRISRILAGKKANRPWSSLKERLTLRRFRKKYMLTE